MPAAAACFMASINDLFVSPEGNDEWSGSLPELNAERTDGPLAMLAGACNAIHRRKGIFFSKQRPGTR